MSVDEEFLKPSRNLLAQLGAKIKTLEAETIEKIERYGTDDKEYAKEKWREFYQIVEPLRREQEAVAKVITDYYGVQPAPPTYISAGRVT